MYPQDWIKDNIGEEANALDEDKSNADPESTATVVRIPEKIMMKNTSRGKSPLVHTKSNQDEDADYQSRQDRGTDPWVQIAAEI